MAVPSVWESDDDGFTVHVPRVWPSHPNPAHRSHGWESYPSLSLALGAAFVQHQRIAGLVEEAKERQAGWEARRQAAEVRRQARAAEGTPESRLVAALAEFVRHHSPEPSE